MYFVKNIIILTSLYFVSNFFLKKFRDFNLMKAYHFHLDSLKEQLFKEAFKQVNTGSKYLDILEIGIGDGQNFKNFPKYSNLTILDINDKFLPRLKKSILENSRDDLKISKLIMNHAENMHSIQSNSMDAVVHTFFLCSVKNTDMVLSEIYRVLKPGGVCIFLEHSIDKKNIFKKWMQMTAQLITGDCKFKDIKAILKGSKYDRLVANYHVSSSILLTFINPQVYGYGIKEKS